MILPSLVGLSLIVTVSAPSGIQHGPGDASALGASTHQKNTIMRPLVRSATECILRAVSADARIRSASEIDVRELIVASMPSCTDAMRAMIDAHDRLYGEGSGEQFFMGPYLDTLPATIAKSVKESRP
jgi:hypothetical protein